MRGPSRPIDPRYAPGAPPRRRFDTFAIGLLSVSVVALVIIIIFLATQNRGTTPQGTQVAGGPTPPPNQTQTAVMFATQTAPEVLPRIAVAEAKALYDANNVKIIDVRDSTFYNQGHIKGAVNIPQAETQSRLSEYPREGNLIVYCQ
jgi:hypothetical protein